MPRSPGSALVRNGAAQFLPEAGGLRKPLSGERVPRLQWREIWDPNRSLPGTHRSASGPPRLSSRCKVAELKGPGAAVAAAKAAASAGQAAAPVAATLAATAGANVSATANKRTLSGRGDGRASSRRRPMLSGQHGASSPGSCRSVTSSVPKPIVPDSQTRFDVTAFEVTKQFERGLCAEKRALDRKSSGFSSGSKKSTLLGNRVHGHYGNPDQHTQDWQSALCRSRSTAFRGVFDFSEPRSRSISRTTPRSRSPSFQRAMSWDRIGGESKAAASHVALFGPSAAADAVHTGRVHGLSITTHMDAAGQTSCLLAEREPRRPNRYAMSEARGLRTMPEHDPAKLKLRLREGS